MEENKDKQEDGDLEVSEKESKKVREDPKNVKKMDKETIQILLDDRISTGG